MDAKGRHYTIRKVDAGTWPPRWPVTGSTVCRMRRHAVQPVTLLVNWYRRPERQNEIDKCLLSNVNNPHIDRIIVAVEPGDVLPVESEKITRWEYTPEPMSGYHCALSFRQWFQRASQEPGIKIVANSDIRFDDSLAVLKTLDLSGRAFALTRWDVQPDGRTVLLECVGSQDVWIFSGKLDVDLSIGMGLPGCDNILARRLHDSGLRLENPCRTIRAIHCHASNIRWWRNCDIVAGIGPGTVMGVQLARLEIDDVPHGPPKPRLALIGLAKGCAGTVGALLDSLAPLTDLFDCHGWASCGDADCARAIRQHGGIPWSIVPDIAKRPGDNRYNHIARLRNSVLSAARRSGFRPDYYLAMDMDAARLVDAAGLPRLLADPEWAAVSVCGLMPASGREWHVGPRVMRDGRDWVYYDTLALETADGVRYLWESGGLWYSHGRGFDPATIFKMRAPPLDFTAWQPVNSAFGPATFYRASALDGLTYDETTEQCEHQGLHQAIRQRGGRHFIASDIIMEYHG